MSNFIVIDDYLHHLDTFVEEYCLTDDPVRAAIACGATKHRAKILASHWMQQKEVQDAITKRKIQMKEYASAITPDYVLGELKRNYEEARIAGNYNITMKALELMGKYCKLFTDKTTEDQNIIVQITNFAGISTTNDKKDN